MPADVAALRQGHARAAPSERDVLPDPIVEFAQCFEHARNAELREPNAMALATVGASGQPPVGIVLR